MAAGGTTRRGEWRFAGCGECFGGEAPLAQIHGRNQPRASSRFSIPDPPRARSLPKAGAENGHGHTREHGRMNITPRHPSHHALPVPKPSPPRPGCFPTLRPWALPPARLLTPGTPGTPKLSCRQPRGQPEATTVLQLLTPHGGLFPFHRAPRYSQRNFLGAPATPETSALPEG